jgi:hypothetical protein
MPATVTNASKAINAARSFFAAYDSHDVDKNGGCLQQERRTALHPDGQPGRKA